jgi:hypothetical protein
VVLVVESGVVGLAEPVRARRLTQDEGRRLQQLREQIPNATICLDPFHVIKWTNEVVESVYRAEAPHLSAVAGMPNRRDWRRTRFVVRAGQNASTTNTGASSGCYADTATGSGAPGNSGNNYATSTAPSIRAKPVTTSNGGAPPHYVAYPRICQPVRRIQKHFEAIIAAVELGLSNSRL